MTDQSNLGPIKVLNYRVFLVDKYRPPSKGGNTSAWHRHSFEVDGTAYSFLALGSKNGFSLATQSNSNGNGVRIKNTGTYYQKHSSLKTKTAKWLLEASKVPRNGGLALRAYQHHGANNAIEHPIPNELATRTILQRTGCVRPNRIDQFSNLLREMLLSDHEF